jgi:hypothetical protein
MIFAGEDARIPVERKMIAMAKRLLILSFLYFCSMLTVNALAIDPPAPGCVRIATFNMALNRKSLGELSRNLHAGDSQAKKIAAIVQIVNPDILLANEVDFDGGESAKLLAEKYLNNASISGRTSFRPYVHSFAKEVNTGIMSGLDLNQDGKPQGPEDAWGYGAFAGQYGMVLYSRFPIEESEVRTFQKFLWNDMPNALEPGIGSKNDGTWKPYYPAAIWSQLRLSSKSHWDLPIRIQGKLLHVLASHPTPPVFDGAEDRNGCRNNDEIRLWVDYIEGMNYMIDDGGRRGGLVGNAPFVILGDLNADPVDGNGKTSAINRLLQSRRINSTFIPESLGASEAAKKQGRANETQKSKAAYDTGDFNDREPGNLRVDFVLPAKEISIVHGGVFWPTEAEMKDIAIDISDASDHHLVWLDIRFP